MARSETATQRLMTLELLLLWEGVLNRSRLAGLLGVSDVRASQQIQEFRDEHPRWLAWNSKTRSYHATPDAYAAARRDEKNHDRADSLARYLNLVSVPYITGNAQDVSPICAAFPDISTPEPKAFATLSRAIRLGVSVEITYRSMKEPGPHLRIIAPHHLVRAGRRWHVRAYCETHQSFRDYAFGRIVSASMLSQPGEHRANDDHAWNAKVPVRLIAHPALNLAQEDVIRHEYFAGTASRIVSCRGALVGYFVQDVRAATDLKTQRPPDYQLAVENLDEVTPWLFPA